LKKVKYSYLPETSLTIRRILNSCKVVEVVKCKDGPKQSAYEIFSIKCRF